MKVHKTHKILIENGWRFIGTEGYARLWDHPNHQHDFHGCFTTVDAIAHQKSSLKMGGCDCIKEESK